MISIRPNWCMKIATGEKRVEIRSTAPKCELPIDCYIYCCRGDIKNKPFFLKGQVANGKVIGKFTLKKIDEFVNGLNWEYLKNGKKATYSDFETILQPSCLTEDDLRNYVDDLSFYGWHIDNLELFDRPIQLNEFNRCLLGRKNCEMKKCDGKKCPAFIPIKNAPQSWGYIEI